MVFKKSRACSGTYSYRNRRSGSFWVHRFFSPALCCWTLKTEKETPQHSQQTKKKMKKMKWKNQFNLQRWRPQRSPRFRFFQTLWLLKSRKKSHHKKLCFELWAQTDLNRLRAISCKVVNSILRSIPHGMECYRSIRGRLEWNVEWIERGGTAGMTVEWWVNDKFRTNWIYWTCFSTH